MNSQTSQDFQYIESELPVWIRKARQGVDYGLIVVLAFCFLAAWPWIFRSSIPQDSILINDAYRSAEYAETLREFRLYPRWSATASFGYGSPIYHYKAPAVPYLVSLLELIITADTIAALRIAMVLIYALMGAVTYTFITRIYNARAGVLGAILYIYSPHAMMTLPFAIGDASLLLAMALYPAILWSTHRLLTEARPFDVAWVVLMASLLTLTHPPSIPFGLLLAAILIIWHLTNSRDKKRIMWVIVAFVLGFCLAGFYWLPAIMEHDLVTWREVIPGLSAWRINWSDLVGTVPLVDVIAFARQPVLALGYAAPIFTLIALAGTIFYGRLDLPSTLFTIAGVLLGLIGLFIIPKAIWLVGAITLCLAITGASVVQIMPNSPKPLQTWLFGGLLLLALILAYPAWLPPEWDESPVETDAGTRLSYELLGLGPAVTSYHNPVPVAIEPGLPPNFRLMANYETDDVIRLQSIDDAQAPEITLTDSQTHRDSYVVSGDGQEVRLLRAHFDGWQANLDGRPLPLSIIPETGLIQFELPPTEQSILEINLGSTPIRQFAWWLSFISLAITIIITWHNYHYAEFPYFKSLSFLNNDEIRLATTLLLLFATLLMLMAFPSSPYRPNPPEHGLNDTVPVQLETEDGLQLIAYELNTEDTTISAGDSLSLTLYWRAKRRLPRNYRVMVILQHDDRNTRSIRTEALVPGEFPTRRWATSGYLRDTHQISIPQTAVPGSYTIHVEVHDCVSECSLTTRRNFITETGESLDTGVELPISIEIMR